MAKLQGCQNCHVNLKLEKNRRGLQNQKGDKCRAKIAQKKSGNPNHIVKKLGTKNTIKSNINI